MLPFGQNTVTAIKIFKRRLDILEHSTQQLEEGGGEEPTQQAPVPSLSFFSLVQGLKR